MSGHEISKDPCHLHCRWNGKDMCLRCLLTPEAIAEHHLSLGVACGLRHIYYPCELPPCVHANGELDWHVSEWEDNETWTEAETETDPSVHAPLYQTVPAHLERVWA